MTGCFRCKGFVGGTARPLLRGAAATLLLGAVVFCGCDPEPEPGPESVPVTVDPASPRGALRPRFLGFAFDTAQLSGGMWWEVGTDGRVVASLPDLEDPGLRARVRTLGPSVLRVGGTDCDAAYFCPEPGPCDLPPEYQETFSDREHRREGVITQEDVARVAAFAEAVDAEILFCVNFGPGPRDASGIWQPENARELIRFARSLPQGERFALWEPGNEINGALFNFEMGYSIDPPRFAEDLLVFRALVDEEAPGALVAAPGSYISPWGEFQDFTADLMEILDGSDLAPLDAVSWHLYATQSTTCPIVIDEAVPAALFDETLNEQHRGFARRVRAAAGRLPVWNTESASAQCGGQKGLSDTLADALWWLDWVGLMAEEGTSLVIRHALVGADYGLLEPDLTPRPTLLAMALQRRHLTGFRFETAADRGRLKAHAFCAEEPAGGLAVVLVNPGDEPQEADINVLGAEVRSAQAWLLAGDAGLASRQAMVNGEGIGVDGVVPAPPGVSVALRAGRARPRLSPASAAVVVLELDPPAASCLATP